MLFFKQKTAYEMRISDWSSDVCSSDLVRDANGETRVEGGRVLFFSLERSAEQLATRILSEQSGVPSDRIRRGEVDEADFGKFVLASQDLHRTPLFIDDTPALTVSAMRTRARRLSRQQGGLQLIVVDYLQLLQGTPGRRSASSEIGKTSGRERVCK